MIVVLDPGALATVQDSGRHGYAHLGVPTAGPLDLPAAHLANRLVGNPEGAAVVESLLGGLAVRVEEGRWLAVTGAPTSVVVGGRPAAWGEAVWAAAGSEVRLGPVSTGMRCYLAVAGGLQVDPVLGSRSTDTLAWVGPPALAAGTELALGSPSGRPAAADVPARRRTGALRVHPGPQADWFADVVRRRLFTTDWSVSEQSNRVGLRLRGDPLERDAAELPSQGMVTGAIQVPADGQPVVFLADHPPTGGYPVIGVVHADDLWQCAQARPGETLRLTPAPGRWPAESSG
jgi:biotin-dependent carboxylase-like uncharacterized protein